MVVLPVELLQGRTEVGTHVPEHLPQPCQVFSGEDPTPVFGDEHQVGVEIVDRVPAST
jgi:hypothetical protein